MSDFNFGVTKSINEDMNGGHITGCNVKQNIINRTLNDVTFSMCNMTGTRFIGTNLLKCSFHKMILGQAVFQQCNLNETKFYHATWQTLVLIDCDLTDVEFKDFDEPAAKPFYTLLLNCNITNTQFSNYDMSQIKMIECFTVE